MPLVLIFFHVSVASAQNKVVVVPLFDDAATVTTTMRVISIPAGAMSYGNTSSPVSPDFGGLRWECNVGGGATITIKAPLDYSGGDVKFHIFFQTTTDAAGIVDFFIRPISFDPGGFQYDPGSINGNSVPVSGKDGFGNFYQQTFVIPADRMGKSWWYTSIQRQGVAATYSDDVIVFGAAFEYQATK